MVNYKGCGSAPSSDNPLRFIRRQGLDKIYVEGWLHPWQLDKITDPWKKCGQYDTGWLPLCTKCCRKYGILW